jgi:hypothetical protein
VINSTAIVTSDFTVEFIYICVLSKLRISILI